jgi:O-antigen/teichoic acid export membrane protein
MPALKTRFVTLLRQLELYTKTDMVYLARGGFWLTFEQILLGLLALAVSAAFARFVSPETYGTYRYLISLFWALSAFSLTGIPLALNRAIAKGEEGAYRQALPLSFWGALPISLIAGGFAWHYFSSGNSTLAYGCLAISVLAPFFKATYLFSAFIEGKRDFRVSAIAGIVLNSVPAISLLVLLRFVDTPLPFFIMYLGSNILVAGVITFYVFCHYRPTAHPSTELKGLGWHLSALGILGTIAGQLDQLLVFHYLGAVELAIYSFATALPDQLKSMATNLSNLAFPKLVTRSVRDIQNTLAQRMLLVSFVFAVAIVLYVALAPLFFKIFFPAYADTVFYSQLYMISLVTIASMIPTTVLNAHAIKRELYIFNVSSAVVQIITLYVGVVWFGLVGLILARACARLFNLVLSTLLVQRHPPRATP